MPRDYPYSDFPYNDQPYQDFPFSGYPYASQQSPKGNKQAIAKSKRGPRAMSGLISLIILPFALTWCIIRITWCLLLLLCKNSRIEKNVRH